MKDIDVRKPQAQTQLEPVDGVIDAEFEEIGGTETVASSPDAVDGGFSSNYVAQQDNSFSRYQTMTSYDRGAHFKKENNLSKYQNENEVYSSDRLASYKSRLLGSAKA